MEEKKKKKEEEEEEEEESLMVHDPTLDSLTGRSHYSHLPPLP